MSRETGTVLDGTETVLDGAETVVVGEWLWTDFPVRGGDWWTTPNPSAPTDLNSEPDYLLVLQANTMREALRRRAVLAGTALTNLPAVVADQDFCRYTWVTGMRTMIEDILTDEFYYYVLTDPTYGYTSMAKLTKAIMLPLVHTEMSGRVFGGTSCGLLTSNTEWTLIGPDATPTATFNYGLKQGTGHEQLGGIADIESTNTDNDATGWMHFSLVSRPGAMFRWESFADVGRAAKTMYSDDFDASGTVTWRDLGAAAKGTIKVTKPAGGFATTATVKAQHPDKRIMWQQHINELYYAIEHLAYYEVKSSWALASKTLDFKTASGALNADENVAWDNGWDDWEAAAYGASAGSYAYKTSNTRDYAASPPPPEYGCTVTADRIKGADFEVETQTYDLSDLWFDFTGESTNTDYTDPTDELSVFTLGGNAVDSGVMEQDATGFPLGTLGWQGTRWNSENLEMIIYFTDDRIGEPPFGAGEPWTSTYSITEASSAWGGSTFQDYDEEDIWRNNVYRP